MVRIPTLASSGKNTNILKAQGMLMLLPHIRFCKKKTHKNHVCTEWEEKLLSIPGLLGRRCELLRWWDRFWLVCARLVCHRMPLEIGLKSDPIHLVSPVAKVFWVILNLHNYCTYWLNCWTTGNTYFSHVLRKSSKPMCERSNVKKKQSPWTNLPDILCRGWEPWLFFGSSIACRSLLRHPFPICDLNPLTLPRPPTFSFAAFVKIFLSVVAFTFVIVFEPSRKWWWNKAAELIWINKWMPLQMWLKSVTCNREYLWISSISSSFVYGQ